MMKSLDGTFYLVFGQPRTVFEKCQHCGSSHCDQARRRPDLIGTSCPRCSKENIIEQAIPPERTPLEVKGDCWHCRYKWTLREAKP